MAIYIYEDVNPTLIPNTTMRLRLRDGVPYSYWITPNEGYVLHDNMGDWEEADEITGETIIKKAYYRGTTTAPASYDFEANPREFYAVPESSVPENQVFGGGGKDDHEVM